VIGGDTIHVTRLLGDPAEEVAATDYDCELHTERVHVRDFAGNFMNAMNIYSKTLTRSQGLSGKLEQDALEDDGHWVKYNGCRRSAIGVRPLGDFDFATVGVVEDSE
jgi:hypothetical protein